MGISPKNVGIFEEKNGGDMWGFLIAEVGISNLNHLETLSIKTKLLQVHQTASDFDILIEIFWNSVLKVETEKMEKTVITCKIDII